MNINKMLGKMIFFTLTISAYALSLCYNYTFGIVLTTLWLFFIGIGFGVDLERNVPTKFETDQETKS